MCSINFVQRKWIACNPSWSPDHGRINKTFKSIIHQVSFQAVQRTPYYLSFQSYGQRDSSDLRRFKMAPLPWNSWSLSTRVSLSLKMATAMFGVILCPIWWGGSLEWFLLYSPWLFWLTFDSSWSQTFEWRLFNIMMKELLYLWKIIASFGLYKYYVVAHNLLKTYPLLTISKCPHLIGLDAYGHKK